jgi:hypothetical protein
MLGSYFYLFSKSDWVYTSVYENMQIYYQNKFKAKHANSDYFERVETMEKYIEDLEF